MRDEEAARPVEAPLGQLERTLIDEFIRARGYDSMTIRELPEAAARALMAEASVYASGKLMEVEARAQYLDEIHHRTSDTT